MADDLPRPAYERASTDDRLRCGETLSSVIERKAVTSDSGEPALQEIDHSFVVVATQDCDLEQDARARFHPDGMTQAQIDNALLSHVLLVVASEYRRQDFAGDIRKRITLNKDERYHYLSPVPDGCDSDGGGIGPLVVDFKRLFSYPTDELYAAIRRGEIKRRARLIVPYAEHFSVRLGYFFQRVGLPCDHHDLATQLERTAEGEPSKLLNP